MQATFAIIFLFLAGCVSSGSKTVTDYLPDEYDLPGLVQENLAVAQASGTSLYTYAGVGLFVIGALSFAFGFNRTSGLQLIAAGAVAGSVPFVVASSYFAWIIGATMIAIAGLGVWHLWFKIKQAENANDAEASKKD